MNHLKKLMLLALFGAVTLVFNGCGEEAVTEVIVPEVTQKEPVIKEMEENVTEFEIPASYNYIDEGNMPILRDQGKSNTCWAFASLSALEASKDADGMNGYSTEHLIWQNPFGKQFEQGGSHEVTAAYLLSWAGPVPTGSFEEEGVEPSVHVQEIRRSEPKDYETIKRFVYLYGGVESGLYMDFEDSMLESPYYNEESYAYCYLGEEGSNHDIVIIGWDDFYAAEKFPGNVTTDGAFLCQNSWGDNFGDQGIFYVSYEDVNIGKEGIVYSRIDKADNYDKIYQSDLCGSTANIGYDQEEAWFANVYRAEEAIDLRAAGFYATGKNTMYEIYVVSKFTDEKSFSDKKYICNGFLEDAGYYTVDFSESVAVEAGNDFAVVVKIYTENAKYPVAIESVVEGFSDNADISDGRSYLSLQGTQWEHLEKTKGYNICLKAYADY